MSSTRQKRIPKLGREYSGIPRVVVAEDDEIFRALICDLLREAGLTVCEARDGVELLEILAQSAGSADHGDRVDLVVSDVCVPEYGSIELILGIHAAKMGIPLITITAFGERRAQVLCHHPEDITLQEEAFDLDGFRDIVLDLLHDRSVPKSMRITLRPPNIPTQRPSDSAAVSGDTLLDAEALSHQSHGRASSLPPQLASLC
jgi:two-component system, response regulator, stage 0 sporulation protein F